MQNGMTVQEMLALPGVIDMETARQVVGCSRTHLYQMARTGKTPFAILKVGNRYRVPTAPLLRYLGVDTNDSDHDPRTQGSASNEEPLNSCVVKTKGGIVIRPDRHYKFRGESWSGADIIAIAQLLGVA